MAIPSSQVLSAWVKSELVSIDWILLRDICFLAIRNRWTGRSEDEILDLVEDNIDYVAEQLRNEAAECFLDGSAPRFEIDDEQSPYIRAIGIEASGVLLKLRRIDPFELESVCAKLLERLGASASVTQRTNDGGIDFIGKNLKIVPQALSVPMACHAAVIGQAKRYKDGNIVGESRIREFVGAATLKKHSLQTDGSIGPLTPVLFAFWTTSDFDPNAKKFSRAVGLWHMDGHTLATYVMSLGLTDFVSSLPEATPQQPAI
jgi:hypothetical protein